MRTVIKCIIVYLALTIFFVLSLLITSCIPSSVIHQNVKESAEVLYEEGNRKIVHIPYRNFDMQFNNYTDALMINNAYSIDSRYPLESALLARKNYLPEKTKVIVRDNVGELKSSSKYKYHNEVGELVDLVNNDVEESFEYARYWHGYLVILRVLLVFFNISTIRIILFIAIFALMIALFYLLQKKTNIIIGIIFEIGLFCVEYFYLGYTLESVFVFLIMMITSIIILLFHDKMKSKVVLFFAVGMITNFFDFLTVPMITLFVPLMIVILLNEREQTYSWKKCLLEIIKVGVAWGIGYGITWLTKWLLVDIILNRNLIEVALGQVGYRSVAREYTLFEAIGPNWGYEKLFIPISMLLTAILSIIYLLKNRDKKQENNVFSIFVYLLFAITPYIWYSVLKNHSAEHSFFTYRHQLITLIALNICIYKFIIFAHRTVLELKKKEE